MTDSETRGWKRDEYGSYTKDINGIEYSIFPIRCGGWSLRAGFCKQSVYQYLDNAKRAAHAHARETK